MEEELKCSHCRRYFEDPILLGCGHSYCRCCALKVYLLKPGSNSNPGPRRYRKARSPRRGHARPALAPAPARMARSRCPLPDRRPYRRNRLLAPVNNDFPVLEKPGFQAPRTRSRSAIRRATRCPSSPNPTRASSSRAVGVSCL